MTSRQLSRSTSTTVFFPPEVTVLARVRSRRFHAAAISGDSRSESMPG